ncbi:MAG: chitobiase/beta-hexosaminidase C-terminal domain-containing protein [Spirochaetaceae bacterium]|jgi:hypothetical protein|nr:chitobiase/beta-hexosaminidase C-terminal domain-containing protein [Spirochaetaceae bacterium]
MIKGWVFLTALWFCCAVGCDDWLQGAESPRLPEISEEQVAAPVAEPAGGVYLESPLVTLTTETKDAFIWYTTDGSLPQYSTTRTEYYEPFSMPLGGKLLAVAKKFGIKDSETLSEIYSKKENANKPNVVPLEGLYNKPLSVSIVVSNPEAKIYYTLDGSDPTTQSTLFSEKIELTEEGQTVIRAICKQPNVLDSEIMTKTFVLDFTPPGELTEITIERAWGGTADVSWKTPSDIDLSRIDIIYKTTESTNIYTYASESPPPNTVSVIHLKDMADDKSYIFQFVIRDKAGNITAMQTSIIFPPVIL